MKLAPRCYRSFGMGDRDRGDGYFAQRRVLMPRFDPDRQRLSAAVRGSGGTRYEVRINWSRLRDHGEVEADCDCPRFDDGFLCKHIWATILTIDEFDQWPSVVSRRVRVIPSGQRPVPDTEDSWNDADLMASDSDLVADEGIAARLARLELDAPSTKPPVRTMSDWTYPLLEVRRGLGAVQDADKERQSERSPRIWYVLDQEESLAKGELVVQFFQQRIKRDGSLSRLWKKLEVGASLRRSLAGEVDGQLLEALVPASNGETRPLGLYASSYAASGWRTAGRIAPWAQTMLLPQLCGTGRFGWIDGRATGPEELHRLAWDDGEPWKFRLVVEPAEWEEPEVHAAVPGGGIRRSGWCVTGYLQRGDQARGLSEPLILLRRGIVVFSESVARLDADSDFPWIRMLRDRQQLLVPAEEQDELTALLYSMPRLPAIELPEALRLREVREPPVPCILFRCGESTNGYAEWVEADVWFEYGNDRVPLLDGPPSIVDSENQCVRFRHAAAEQEAVQHLLDLGMEDWFQRAFEEGACDLVVSISRFAAVARQLIDEGWHVEADGQRLRAAGGVSVSVSSDVDWFDVAGEVEFGDTAVELPALLKAIRGGSATIRLGDGSYGIIPEDWIDRFRPLANLAPETAGGAIQDIEGKTLRFLPSQAMLLDTLLAGVPQVDVDRQFAALRERLRGGCDVRALSAPRGFRGELRDYQREGLGWLEFLHQCRFGGCLADDMGLGKTVQVLAWLQRRRLRGRARTGAALIVVPRSLLHNWIDEAARFTPRLQVLNYTGPHRKEQINQIDAHDVVVTTYGTLRRDVTHLQETVFDYAILDEAQAIKNASSQAAKACRLVQARHRLALTGTPVENHIGELWSIFEFLNPGMLGRLPAIERLSRGNGSADDESLEVVARALRPFVLRRTKEQVLKQLPPKTEQTLYCQLSGKQRQLYDELRKYYRTVITQRIDQIGLRRAKIHVLEALLRLRQAACHPGLIDDRWAGRSSAKLDALLEQLREVTGEGHKALVFSQFTSMLSIVRVRLEREEICYEYLDGRTRDRKQRVDRFQNDAQCPVFLISLKAGGLGLNLTAADYVYILDPWWNPAVEAQAVDRAHRIGQEKPVFAYRLIAQDTVEEKILELQQRKRDLAEAIITADNSLIRRLTPEDLQILLG